MRNIRMPVIVANLKPKYPNVYHDASFLVAHRCKLPRPPEKGPGYTKRMAEWRKAIVDRADEMFELIVAKEERAEAAWIELITTADVTPRTYGEEVSE